MFNSIVKAIFHNANAMPGKLCLADDYDQLTYGEYAERIRHYAGVFVRDGISQEDRVVVEASQSIEYLAIAMAVQFIGAILVPVERNCAPEKIAYFARSTDAKAVIARRSESCEVSIHYIPEELKQLANTMGPIRIERFPSREMVSEILFSTGTTGKEKGVILTHGNNVALAENVIHGVEMPRNNVEMILSPMNHSHGLRRYYANMINCSSVILLGSAMNMKQFFENMDKFDVNAIDLVPAALSTVLKLSRGRLANYQSQLNYVQLGSAPLNDADRVEICSLLPRTRLYNFYGSTESGCIAIYNFNQPNAKKSCVGKPTCNTEICIVDEKGCEIASSETNSGFLASKGPMNMSGYWADTQETKKALRNGTVYSSDIAYIDHDGDIILLGRQGDIINVGGKKVSPEEIEDAARNMEDIVDCGVVPVDDPYKGSVPGLYVQLCDGCALDPIAIRTFLAKYLEPYKLPTYIRQVDLIPRSSNGKLLRRQLRQDHVIDHP